MCLATVQKSDDTVVCRNVSRIDVDGEKGNHSRYYG